ncbi:sigma-70 family RNA polymerase sigma factor [Streptomyces sp. MP131-18]|uniref:BACON domain-containing protein n=1 Tax=Streptomyces sp. MP131-18 TaxID=1857892 RepID=UPI00117E7A70|nr:sigma-70 family RNA polymerase sigma factor [Streptomyces sp. MP131-18]
MTRSRERPARGAHRPAAAPSPATKTAASPADAGASATRPRKDRRQAAYDDAYLDGLFTYCLSVMCEHDAATAALGEALALAERQHESGRRPADPALARAWLYALARWACLRRLAVHKGEGEGRPVPRAFGEDAARRHRELAALSWPEAAGTTPEQREALELAVRHQLSARELARVLRLAAPAAHTLLTAAAREVERTRAALAAVDAAGCPAAAALSGDDRGVLLGPAMRRELLRHVDECPSCRLIAQRATAEVGWPATGSSGPSRLTVLPAPRAAVQAARLAIRRARSQYAPRYDRAGFPLFDKDKQGRRERLRSRVVTSAVAVTVVAVPVLALWAACRGAPPEGESAGEDTAAAAEDTETHGTEGAGERPYETTGRTGSGTGSAEAAEPGSGADGHGRDGAGEEEPDATDDGAGRPADAGTDGGADRGEETPAAGELVVDAVPTDAGTRITLTATGGAPVDWSAVTDVPWLSLSRASGTLGPGESAVIEVTVDRAREPAGEWQGRITVGPAAAVVTVEGSGPEGTEPPEPPDDPETPESPPGEPGTGPDEDAGQG